MNRYARLAGVIGFVGATATGLLVTTTPDTTVSACGRGEHASVSKYAGSVCIPDGGKVGKGVAQVTMGCVLGLPAGLPGLGWGCAGGMVSVILDNS